jgi:hypothetical protein
VLFYPDRFDIGVAGFAVQTPFGVRSPDVVVDLANPHRHLSASVPIFSAELGMATVFRGVADAPRVE